MGKRTAKLIAAFAASLLAGTSTVAANAASGPVTENLPSPVFPLTLTSDVTPIFANVTAVLRPRPQDLGTVASVFVFAHAPASVLAGRKRAPSGSGAPASALADSDPCVLAQFDVTGNLLGVDSETMEPSAGGVMAATGLPATVLLNTPTGKLAGITVFVGYGPNAASMLANGVYEPAIAMPGTPSCVESLAASPLPASPSVLSGLWNNAGEPGWGIYFAQRRNTFFGAWYTYDGAGKAKWYVAPSCVMPGGTSGTCTGPVFEASGPPFPGVPFDPARVHAVPAGNVQVGFGDGDHAFMTYTVGGVTRSVALERDVFEASDVPPAIDFTDLWWNPAESGWGLAITHQYGAMFLAWFVYDAQGRPTWYVASDCVVSGNSCTGTLFRTTGPPFGPTYDYRMVHADAVGTASVVFGDANSATFSYTVDGVSGSKAITRQTF